MYSKQSSDNVPDFMYEKISTRASMLVPEEGAHLFRPSTCIYISNLGLGMVFNFLMRFLSEIPKIYEVCAISKVNI